MKLNYFNFRPFEDKILLTNDFGKYVFVDKEEFKLIISKNVKKGTGLWDRLFESNMIYDCSELEYSSDHMYDLREAKRHLGSATALHIFVVTTSCNLNCIYCQANSGSSGSHLVMDTTTAEKAVDLALQSPEKQLSFEFQGGEPFINFSVIKHIVTYAEQNKKDHLINYSVVSNLTLLTDEMIEFFAQHHFFISTSIDGPKQVHDRQRIYPDGMGSFENTNKKIEKIKRAGLAISAIETTSKFSLEFPEEIVQTYIDLGFDSIFIRPLTPLGKASALWEEIGYTAKEFVEFYKRAVEKILDWNIRGVFIKENHAAIFLNKILGNFVNYMELRSPCGAGVGQLAYYPDGLIFTCDEGRMCYEMGDDSFCLGDVDKDSYQGLIKNSLCKTVCASSILESLPECCDCVYQPYCGTCPVVNYAQCSDIIEKQPHGYKCQIYAGILNFLFSKLKKYKSRDFEILRQWVE